FLKVLWRKLSSVKLVGFLLVAAVMTASAASRNVLLIIADDYGIDSHSLYNTNSAASLPPTPNINALAQRGVLFRNAYGQPVCSPSRCAMLTGRYGFRNGVTQVVESLATPGVQTNEYTLPEVISANAQLSYSCASIGKWHLGGAAAGPNTAGGWPHFSGSLGGALASYTSWMKTVDGRSTPNYSVYATTDNVNDALSWIQQRGTNRWFLWLAFNAGHTPYHKPPNNLHSYDSLSGTQADITANPRPYYEAMIESMDTEIGRLLSQIDTNQTTILFLGDNGTQGRVIQPPFSSSRGKDSLYEGGVRVPFIVAGPDIVNRGRSSDAVVHCVDLYATILDLVGVPLPAVLPTDSRSLLPVLLSQPFTPAERAILVENETTAPAGQSGRAVRYSNFKLIQPTGSAEEFYDLARDPLEATNLLLRTLTAEQQATLALLHAKLDAWRNIPNAQRPEVATQFALETSWFANANLSLWRSPDLGSANWIQVTNAMVQDHGFSFRVVDPQPPFSRAFYRLRSD
ncbi:MAG TPA: sulfatase-like hydrolase/transferase, partial [Verrucomicrobiae bacterium]|nr:sulfatase-like hydrolase/transferase [Verrucomicrobiae bacterium]